jgi:hypothetical protein
MMYKAKDTVYSEVRTKHSTQRERHVEFSNVLPLDFRRLNEKEILSAMEQRWWVGT